METAAFFLREIKLRRLHLCPVFLGLTRNAEVSVLSVVEVEPHRRPVKSQEVWILHHAPSHEREILARASSRTGGYEIHLRSIRFIRDPEPFFVDLKLPFHVFHLMRVQGRFWQRFRAGVVWILAPRPPPALFIPILFVLPVKCSFIFNRRESWFFVNLMHFALRRNHWINLIFFHHVIQLSDKLRVVFEAFVLLYLNPPFRLFSQFLLEGPLRRLVFPLLFA